MNIKFWSATYALLVLLVGANLPTPLYRHYQERFAFSPIVVTLIFATYVATLIPTLIVAGPLSDAIGRRRVVLPAIVLAALACVVFATAGSPGWLFVARALQGVAVGAASGSLTAALSELEPTGDQRRAALVATATSVSGLALGPLVTGLVAETMPAPQVTPFVLEGVLLCLAFVAAGRALTATPTTAWHPRRPTIPAGMRSVFGTTGSANFIAFAVTGLFLALIPTLVATLTGSTNPLLGGGVAGLILAASALTQVASYRSTTPRGELTGLLILASGLGILLLSVTTGSLPPLLAASVVAGVGHGLVFLGGLTTINQHAPAARRAEVVSSFYVIVYAGVGVPVIGVGLLAATTTLTHAVGVFAGLFAALALLTFGALLKQTTRRPG